MACPEHLRHRELRNRETIALVGLLCPCDHLSKLKDRCAAPSLSLVGRPAQSVLEADSGSFDLAPCLVCFGR